MAFLVLALLGLTSVLSVENFGQACMVYETACGSGCCPYQDAVCCSDGYECCRQGQICIPYLGICIGLESPTGRNVSLISEQTVPVQARACQREATPCATGCCPLEDAVCCEDGVNCCPKEHSCTQRGCVAENSIIPSPSKKIGKFNSKSRRFNPMMTGVQRGLGKTCPDGILCPETTSCCIGDDDNWSCCPKSANIAPMMRMMTPPQAAGQPVFGGECCNTYVGYTCCTVLAPKCHYWGCWWW